MKYLKYFEKLENKIEMNLLLHKYVIFHYLKSNYIGIGRVVLIENSYLDFDVWLDIYDKNGKILNCKKFKPDEFNVLENFRTIEEAIDKMKTYSEIKKYNL